MSVNHFAHNDGDLLRLAFFATVICPLMAHKSFCNHSFCWGHLYLDVEAIAERGLCALSQLLLSFQTDWPLFYNPIIELSQKHCELIHTRGVLC